MGLPIFSAFFQLYILSLLILFYFYLYFVLLLNWFFKFFSFPLADFPISKHLYFDTHLVYEAISIDLLEIKTKGAKSFRGGVNFGNFWALRQPPGILLSQFPELSESTRAP